MDNIFLSLRLLILEIDKGGGDGGCPVFEVESLQLLLLETSVGEVLADSFFRDSTVEIDKWRVRVPREENCC